MQAAIQLGTRSMFRIHSARSADFAAVSQTPTILSLLKASPWRFPGYVPGLFLLMYCRPQSNMLILSTHSGKFVAVKHYGEALRLLIEALSMPDHEHALTASMLLLSYEIHSRSHHADQIPWNHCAVHRNRPCQLLDIRSTRNCASFFE
jgi:hypothetical protein